MPPETLPPVMPDEELLPMPKSVDEAAARMKLPGVPPSSSSVRRDPLRILPPEPN